MTGACIIEEEGIPIAQGFLDFFVLSVPFSSGVEVWGGPPFDHSLSRRPELGRGFAPVAACGGYALCQCDDLRGNLASPGQSPVLHF